MYIYIYIYILQQYDFLNSTSMFCHTIYLSCLYNTGIKHHRMSSCHLTQTCLGTLGIWSHITSICLLRPSATRHSREGPFQPVASRSSGPTCKLFQQKSVEKACPRKCRPGITRQLLGQGGLNPFPNHRIVLVIVIVEFVVYIGVMGELNACNVMFVFCTQMVGEVHPAMLFLSVVRSKSCNIL